MPLSRPPLIALVEDDAAMRDALCDLLLVAGLSSQPYGSAAAFLHEYVPDRFALLITDVRMPKMDGIELLRRLGDLGSDLPAIVITSSLDPETCARARKAGAKACLTKPVNDRALLRLIGRIQAGGG